MTDLYVGLTLAERFALIPRLPQKGNHSTMARVRELHEKLIPTPAEEKTFGIRTDEQIGRTSWSSDARTAIAEIPIGETMNDAIVKTLTALDKSGELIPADVTLYEKFVLAAEPVADEEPGNNGKEDAT